METRYDPKIAEQRWYAIWEERGYFKPRESLTGKTFTISMPPPNITGDLHMGHAMYTLQDVLIRWHRMLGDAALWVPGTDHAAIATQNVLEKQLAKQGTSRRSATSSFGFGKRALSIAAHGSSTGVRTTRARSRTSRSSTKRRTVTFTTSTTRSTVAEWSR